MKKVLVFFLIFLAGFMVFAAGGSQNQPVVQSGSVYRADPNLNAPGVFPIAKTRVPLKIGIEAAANVENHQTNWMTRQLEERGNFSLTFEVYPTGERAQKVELMVMAGGNDLPDAIIGPISMGIATKYGQAGMIIPLNMYYENCAYWSREAAKDVDFDPLKYVTSSDGNIYGVYGINVSLNNSYSAGRINILEPWLIKLGLKMPETTDQFLNTLRAFRDQDPNGNGIKDEIPMISFRENMQNNYLFALMTPFIYTQMDFWLVNNGVIDVAFNKPAWREGIRYSKQLYDEGLLLPMSFTQDQTQMTALIGPDPAKVGVVNRISMTNLGVNDIKRSQYLAIPPLQGPGGRQSFFQMQLPDLRMIISKNCKNPEAAFRLGDLFGMEEFSLMCRWGEKGVDWLPADASSKSSWGALGNPMVIEILPYGTLQNKYWGEAVPRMLTNKHSAMDIDTGDPYHVFTAMGRTIEDFVKYRNLDSVVAGLIYTDREQEIVDQYHSVILSYVRECFARFVTGDMNIDREWDSYVNEFNRMGLSQVIGAAQAAYNRMYK